jgi:outer membrane protein OmpA-like peptidoglycan-associated protein/tetratricopeptide (TPR) repeat protein
MFLRVFLVFFIICNIGYSQNPNKQIKKAENSTQNYSFVDAIEIYEGILKKSKGISNEELIKVKLKLAEAYFFVKDYTNAEKYYSEALNTNPILKGEELKSYQRYAQVLSTKNKYKEAAEMYTKYTDLQEQDKRGIEFSKLYTNLEPLTRNSSSYKLEYIGINTSSPDFSPTFYKNGLVFVSGRSNNNAIKRVFKWDNSSFLDLYYLEDLKILGKEDPNPSIGSGGDGKSDTKNNSDQDKLGADYYTPPTPNDANTIGHQGSDYINGSKNYEENSIIEVKKFSKNINSKYHEGPSTFFHDGSKIIFTRNGNSGGGGIFGNKKDGIVRLKLYSADKKGNDWTNISELPFNANEYSCGHPTMNFKDDVMYFVSDMPGGYGGTDIYMVKFENGKWGKPENLGGKVNTIGNEMFPFIDDSNGLYFSSDGHPGLGELDIFFIKTDTKTNKPVGRVRNLGAPINSNFDDFGILTDPSRSIGYFSTNRKRGGADDDIWKFTRVGSIYGCKDVIVSIYDEDTKMPIEKFKFDYQLKSENSSSKNAITNAAGSIKLCLEAESEFTFSFDKEGFVSQTTAFSNLEASDFEPSLINIYLKKEVIAPQIIPNKEITEKRKGVLVQKARSNNDSKVFRGIFTGGENNQPISGVKVKFINKCNGEIQEVYTKRDGSYEFRRDPECDYELLATKDDFGTSSEIIPKSIVKTLFGKKRKPSVSLNLFDTKLYKVGDVIRLENIYYESDSYKIRENAKNELDKLINTLKRYPNMIIEISSHTDTRGNALTNQRLSQARANEVYKYIVSKGIDKAKVKAIGKGESEPLNACSDGVQCTESEHQRNRRTEFKILTIEKIQ